jgi:FeS assembly SUF system regulator
MLRITKTTDYGIILLTQLAAAPDAVYSAAELSAEARIPLPMASKILKHLTREGILESRRGAKGGYVLALSAEQISVARIIDALEGPFALTECIALGPGGCEQEPVCPTRTNWHRINSAVYGALAQITLAEMCRPLSSDSIGLSRRGRARPIELLS